MDHGTVSSPGIDVLLEIKVYVQLFTRLGGLDDGFITDADREYTNLDSWDSVVWNHDILGVPTGNHCRIILRLSTVLVAWSRVAMPTAWAFDSASMSWRRSSRKNPYFRTKEITPPRLFWDSSFPAPPAIPLAEYPGPNIAIFS